MPFSLILGNENAKITLTHHLQRNTLPQSLLFSGLEGVGKALFARTVAALLMGADRASRVERGNHPDVHELYPEGKAFLHPIENIRAMIKEASYPPFEAPVKVFILHEANRMLSTSSNALLKILEEPQKDTYFFLVTSQADALLSTLVSRLYKISFFPIPDSEIEDFARQRWNKDTHEARRIALLAHGSLARARRVAKESDQESRMQLIEFLTLALPEKYQRLLELCSTIEKSYGKEGEGEEETKPVDDLLEEIYTWYRDLTLLQSGVDERFIVYPEAKKFLEQNAEKQIPRLEEVLERLLLIRSGLERHIPLRVLLEGFRPLA
jgi:DNA polymerase III subunit delta'